jgi:prophage regulatory protein
MVAPAFFGEISTPFSGVIRTTVIAKSADKSVRDLSRFFDDTRRCCAYFIGLNRLYRDDEMLAKKIWRLPVVLEQTGLSRSTIYEMISRGEFPRQINLGPRAVGWVSDDVLGWIDFKIREAQSHDSRS